MKIIVVNETTFSISPRKLQKQCDEVCKALEKKRIRNKRQLKAKELTCVFLTPQKMRKVNKQFRQKDKPTDVLSFESADPDSFGELLFCPTVLTKQARLQKHAWEHELLYMMIHGVLHILGYDHELSKREEKMMFKIQDQIFEDVQNRLLV